MRMRVRGAIGALLVSLAPALVHGQGAKPRANPAPAGKDSVGEVVMREVYSYSADGRRDPFVSLMATGEIRPLLADLSLIGVIYDTETPRRSVAILTDGTTGQTYRVNVGSTLGRLKIARIGKLDVTFTVDEFGLSRQQTLQLDKTPKKDAKTNTTRRPQ